MYGNSTKQIKVGLQLEAVYQHCVVSPIPPSSEWTCRGELKTKGEAFLLL